MTTSKKKKGSTATPRKQQTQKSPGITTNRFGVLDTTPENPTPLYSEVASSNRISEIPVPMSKVQDTPKTEPSLSALLSAIQSINFRFDDQEENLNEKFKYIDDRFDTMDSRSRRESSAQVNEGLTKIHSDNCDDQSNDDHTSSDIDNDHDSSSVAREQSNASQHQHRPNSRRGNYNRYQAPASADSQPSYLNQNQFSIAMTNSSIKFDKIETYLSSKTLIDDSAEALKTIYSSIVRSIAYGFACQLSIMPSFHDLDRNIRFEPLFLNGLFSDNLSRAKTVYDQIGEILLDFLKSDTTITESKAPEAFTIVKANPFVSGWELLETILRQRLTMCGADLDDDLDEKRIQMVFQANESYREFYVRIQQLYNEYKYHATDSSFIPLVKLMRKFLQQLSRCPAYRPTITSYQTQLSEHISEFGIDNNLSQLMFDFKEVYDQLVKAKVPKVPFRLDPDDSDQQSKIKTLQKQNDSYTSLIASLTNLPNPMDTEFDNIGDDYEDSDPTIAKFVKKPKCQACLLGNHNENDCFLRGDKFIPDNLKRRLKVYNKVHGDAPPVNHKIREWNPPLIPPIHSRNLNNSNESTLSQNRNSRRPFSNTKTKSRDPTIKLFNFDDNEEGCDEVQEDILDNPSMSALINDQMQFENSLSSNAFDDTNPTMCTFSSTCLSIQSLVSEQLHFESKFNIIDDNSHPFSIHSARSPNENDPPIQSSVQSQPPDPMNVPLTNPTPATINQTLLQAIRSFRFRRSTDQNQQDQDEHSSTTSTTTHVSSLTDAGTITSNENTIDNDSNNSFVVFHPVINSTVHRIDDDTSIPFGNRVYSLPSSLPFNHDAISRNYETVQMCTPKSILQSILRIHKKCNNIPNKTFFKYHANQIQNVDNDQFLRYCSLTFHVDGGANCGSIKDRSLFYFFVEGNGEITTVAGTKVKSQGWGAVLMQVGDKVCLVGPLYYFPNHPQNTLSPGLLMNYNEFIDATVRTNRQFELLPPNAKSIITIPFNIHNDLDFATFDIMIMTPSKDHIIAKFSTKNIPLRRSARLAIKYEPMQDNTIQNDNTKLKRVGTEINTHDLSRTTVKPPAFYVVKDANFANQYTNLPTRVGTRVISRSVFNKILEYVIQITSPLSPRDQIIQNFNSMLGNTIRSPEATYPSRALKAHHLSLHPNNHEIVLPIIASFSRASIRSLTPHQHWILLHLGTMHTSSSTLDPLIKNDLLTDLPPSLKSIASFDCTCWICNLRKATKVPRGKLVDCSELAPFQRIHVDFSFFTVVSIRGFTSALDVTCASTSYPFGFPTKSKSPPIEILRWLLGTLRSMGHVVNFIRVDEGGELANSSSFAEFVFKCDCVLESTGAGNSTNNGKVERQNRTKADMTRAGLSTLNLLIKDDLPDDLPVEKFWCLAYQHSNFIKRRMFHRLRKSTPHFLVSQKKPSARELVPLGAYMTVIHPNKNLLPKLSMNRATRAYFMGYANHTKIRLYWEKSNPYTIKRSSNSIIEDVPTLLKLEKCFSSPFLNQANNNENINAKDFTGSIVTSDMVDIVDCPFQPDDILTIKIPLPSLPSKLGLILKSDLIAGLPVIQSTVYNSQAYKYLKPGQRSNMYVISINGQDQLSSNAASLFIQDLQNNKHEYLTLEVVKRNNNDNTTSLVSYRSIFDQVPSLHPTNPTIASSFTPSHKPSAFTEFVSSASKPTTPSSFFEALKSPYKQHWKAAAWKHFTSNQKVVTFSKPFPKDDIPTTAKTLRSLLVLEVKPTDVPGIWQFKIRHAIVGTPQEQYIDYDDSYAPTVDPTTVKIQICFTCHCNYTLGIIDVKNAFQNTIAPSKSRLYCTLPPTYLEWLTTVYHEQFKPGVKYLIQMLNSCQGTKDASCLFYKLLRKALEGYGFIRSTVDHAYFVKSLGDGHHLFASVATDDILVSFPCYQAFDDLRKYMKQFFELSIQTGPVLKFLGVRYVQSDHCITLDQAEYTHSMLEHYFGTNVDYVKTIRTPMRYDTEYEKELYDALPLPPKALQLYSTKYKGAFRFWIGKFMFLCTQTRFDIGFAVQRLSEFNSGPTQPAFESIVRILRFLAGDILRPLTYPKKRFDGKDHITWYATPDSKHEMKVPHEPSLFFDAEFAKDIASRHSYSCNIITVYNVAVLFKVKKSSAIMLHTTDSELKGGSSGVRQLLPVRQLFAFNGHPLELPSQAYTDNAAVHAIVESNRMTPRCKHYDIPIAFLHQENNSSYRLDLIRTMIMLADMGTKANTPQYHKQFKYWASGERFLPPLSSQHAKLIQMKYYEMNYGKIISSCND